MHSILAMGRLFPRFCGSTRYRDTRCELLVLCHNQKWGEGYGNEKGIKCCEKQIQILSSTKQTAMNSSKNLLDIRREYMPWLVWLNGISAGL